MGVIQNSINSALGSATQAAGLVKIGKEMQEKNKIESINSQLEYDKHIDELKKDYSEAEINKIKEEGFVSAEEKALKRLQDAQPELAKKDDPIAFLGNVESQWELEDKIKSRRGQIEAFKNRQEELSKRETLLAEKYGVKNKNLERKDLGGKK